MSPADNARPIKVLLIGPSMNILGGQAVQVSRLRREVDKFPSIAMTFLAIDPVLPESLREVRFIRTILRFILYLPQILAAIPRCEVLHVFSAGYTSYSLWTLPALLIGRLTGKKVILNYHDGQGEDHLRRSRFARESFRLADVIITPSNFLVDVFKKFSITAYPILNCIDTSHFPFRERGPLQPVFMTNRILEPLYNVECLLRAFARIQKRIPEASLTVAHDGPSKASLEQYARDLGLKNTQFIGRVPHERVHQLYNDAEIYITTPNIDNMPVSLLECFATGLPIIATRAGGIPYVATHEKNALLVDINDDAAVAEAAFRLLDDPALVKRLTADGREEALRYNPIPVGKNWVALYHRLMGRPTT